MRLAEIIESAVGRQAPLEFTAYDGSRTGDRNAPVRIELRSPIALSYLASAPGELGLARAYVSGALDIHGAMYTALSSMATSTVTDHVSPRVFAQVALRLGAARLWWPVSRPAGEARVHGRRHSKRRDQEAIAHHYDVSNRFYEWVLGPSMAYTCAVYPTDDASLEEAQWTKHDLVARKLGLREGMRLLDVGCGWGGMVMHAARHYGVRALGVTLSRKQAEWAQKKIAESGLSDLAEVRHLDYRDVAESGFDAVSSIGLTEHIGVKNYPAYFGFIRDKLRPGGRVLNHCITRPRNNMRFMPGSFIDRYVFPDGELTGSGRIILELQDAGLEVRHEENLREHYALTLKHWCANLVRNWDECVAQVGEGTARVWGLYMAGSRYGFESDEVQLHQVLAVKTHDDGAADFPLRPTF
jgi:cyclopropane-fatty-acyl-phospholipid synthase